MAEHQDSVHFSLSKPDSLEQSYEQQSTSNNNNTINNTDIEEGDNVSTNLQTSWRQKTRSPKRKSPHTGFKIDPHYVLAHVRSQRSSPEMKTANKIPSHYEWDNNLTPKYDIPSENPTKIHAVHQKPKKQSSGKSTKKSPKRRTGRFRLLSRKSSRSASVYQAKHGVAIGKKQFSLFTKNNAMPAPPPTPPPTDTIEVPRRRTSRIIYDALASVLSPFTPSPVTPLTGGTQTQTGRPNPGPLTASGKDVITRTLDDDGEEQKLDDAEVEVKEDGIMSSRLSRVDAFHESSKMQGTPLNSARSDGTGSVKGTPPAKPPKKTTPAKLTSILPSDDDKVPEVQEMTSAPNSYRISDIMQDINTSRRSQDLSPSTPIKPADDSAAVRPITESKNDTSLKNNSMKNISGNLVSPLTLETTAVYATNTDTHVCQSYDSKSEPMATESTTYESTPPNSCRVSDILREISLKKAAAESPSISPRPALSTVPHIIDSDSVPVKTDICSASISSITLAQAPTAAAPVVPLPKPLVEEDDGSDVYEDCDDDEEASIARSTASSNIDPPVPLPVITLPLAQKPPKFDAIVINSPRADTQDTPLSSARSEAGRSTKGTPPPKPARKPSLVKVTEPAPMSAEPPPSPAIHKSTGSTSNTWHISDISLLHLTSYTTEPDAASDTGSDATAVSHPVNSTVSNMEVEQSSSAVPADPTSRISTLPIYKTSIETDKPSVIYDSMAYEPTPPNTCRISDIMCDISIRKATSSTDLVSSPPPPAPTTVSVPVPAPPVEVVSDVHSEGDVPTERDILLKNTTQANTNGNLLSDTWKDVCLTDALGTNEVQLTQEHESSDDSDIYEDCIDGEESSVARSSTSHFEPSPCAVDDVDSFSPPSEPPCEPPCVPSCAPSTELKPPHFDVHILNNSSTTIQDTVMSSARSEYSSGSIKGTPPAKPARKPSPAKDAEKLHASIEPPPSPPTSIHKSTGSSLNTWHISDISLLHLTSYPDAASDVVTDTGSVITDPPVADPLAAAAPPADLVLPKHTPSEMPVLPITKTSLEVDEAPSSTAYDSMAYEPTPPNTCRISDIMRDIAIKRAAAEAAESTQDTYLT